MGKSPAKWIKSVILGKKAPKSKIVKGYENPTNEEEVSVFAKAIGRDLATSTLASHLSDADSLQDNLRDYKDDESSPQDVAVKETDPEMTDQLVFPDDPERQEQDQAATKVQALLRGYLARRAYLALKGIIKLQALIRGHLVRRQAVSTIHCMLGIVKLQAHVRGKRVRLSDIGIEVQGKVIFETIWGSKLVNAGEGKYVSATNLFANAFGLKFLTLSPRPLYLQYDSIDPNSVTSWLDRWSASRFWKPVPVPRKLNDSSTPLDQNQHIKTETSRTKRNKTLPSGRVDNGSTRSSLELERSRRTFRKPSSHSIEVSDPEAARSELEKVKRSLRKVHENAFPPAIEDSNTKQSPENIIIVSGQSVPQLTKSIAPQKPAEDPYDMLPTLVDVETSPEHCKVNGVNDSLLDIQTDIDAKPMDNVPHDDKIPKENEDSFVKPDELENEEKKSSMKGSLNAKHESMANGSSKQPKVPSYMAATKSAKAKLRDSSKQPKVPSYMAATKSAKAKLRDQGSSVFAQEASEKSPSTRRHSLPSPTGTKVSSLERTQKLTPSNGKAKIKTDKPLSASKDGIGKADWRR